MTRFRLFLSGIVLCVLPLLFFWPALTGNHLIVSGDFSGSDLLDMQLPFKYILHDSYIHGKVPLWSRYQSNGAPFLAEGQSGALYPPHILLSFLPPVLALNYSFLLALMIGGVGFQLYALRIPKVNLIGSFLGAVCFMFSSFFIARMKHLTLVEVGAFLPWALLFVDLFLRSKRSSWLLALSVIWALQLLVGHPHMAYLSIVMTFWTFSVQLGWEVFHQSFVTPKQRVCYVPSNTLFIY
jgi:hypothetical protein